MYTSKRHEGKKKATPFYLGIFTSESPHYDAVYYPSIFYYITPPPDPEYPNYNSIEFNIALFQNV